ncbi:MULTISPECIES: MFS transporter [Weissella]|uniref:MFS transporter n=1 Tax=Weissella TaxID=46255 RepID=UPI0002191967|nr:MULTISPECIES: MFS transporter [Weissella]APS27453.1 Bicyclomycin resistance protein [Weissella cibaria]APU62851.1 Bicyclomycin resistance protein [Weissella cibaria]APU65002.1 Bicyclomycin resistance protein [Weissella cibaria]ASS51622.1 Bicyclomycin resistance protein [Weissella cibaria]KXU10347.1 transporter [Weissella sp. DD23]
MNDSKPVTSIMNAGFVSITAINFVIYLVYYLLMVIIAVVVHTNLHASLAQAGLASGIYVIGTLLARLFIGQQLDIIGRKQSLRYGAILYLISTLAYLVIPNIGVMFVVRLVNGFAYGMASTATNAIVTDYIPEDKKGLGINFYGLSTSLAAAIGPFVGMILLNLTNFRFIVEVSSALILLTTIATLILPVRNLVLTPERKADLRHMTFDNLIERNTIFIASIGFLMGFSYSSVLSFLSSYAKTIHLVGISSFFFVVYALVITITRPMAGRIFDVKGEDYVMYPSYISLAIGLVILGLTHSGFTLLVAGAFIGLGYGTFMSNGQAVALKMAPNALRVGVSLSTYFIGLDLGIGVGPFVLGDIEKLMNFRELYLLAAIVPVIAGLLYYKFYNHEHDAAPQVDAH